MGDCHFHAWIPVGRLEGWWLPQPVVVSWRCRRCTAFKEDAQALNRALAAYERIQAHAREVQEGVHEWYGID